MKTARIVLPCLALAMAFPAVAQDYTGAVTLGWGKTTFEDSDVENTSLNLEGRIQIALGNGVTVGVKAGRESFARDGEQDGIQSTFGANVAYDLGNGAWAGLYVEGRGLGWQGDDWEYTLTTYGIEGGYSFAGIDFAGFIAPADHTNTYGVSAKYAADTYLVASSFKTARTEGEAEEVFGLAGTYQYNAFGLFAGAEKLRDSRLDGKTVNWGVGASYTYETAVVPVIASIEYGAVEYGFNDYDYKDETVKIGVTFPLGGSKAVAPLNSVADSVINPSKLVSTGINLQ